MLEGVDAIHVATVLDDCVDQLCILGHIMPASYDTRPDANEIVRDEITELVETQRDLEQKFENVLAEKEAIQKTTQKKNRLAEVEKTVGSLGGNLRNSTHVFARSLRQNPLTVDNITKIQTDRGFIEKVMSATLHELIERCSFQSLLEAVKREKEKKAMIRQTVKKEEDGRKRIKLLQRQLLDVRKEKEVELQQRNEMIAHLKDQLQEMKAKTNMEGKYIKKCAEVNVAQTQKRCTLSEKQLKDEIDRLGQQVDEETRCNAEIEAYLRTHQADLEKKVEFWMEKYDKDVDAKQHELDVLKASKAKDLEKLQELTKMYKEYEQVVVEDRIEKEKNRRKQEQEAIELRAATKLQAWWRGVMVRRGLGQYSRKKKSKKGKKGKKGKK